MEKKNYKVKVGVRVRPALEREVCNGKFSNCIGVDDKNKKIYISGGNEPIVINNVEEDQQIKGLNVY